ncbi:hypothetical protein [Bacteroides rodentium]|uniref:hypothetical protein n=1 Tax=Bacteroides rodentium TaxID=691816 RepID=UPI00047296CE|nr:hypothetical protein [Bacteroides rodentium]
MENKKFLRECWNKFFIFMICAIIGISIYLYLNGKSRIPVDREIDLTGTITTAPLLISTNVQWKDSIYKIVLDEIELSWLINEDSKYKIVPPPQTSVWLSYKDTLMADSLLNIGLKMFCTTPQPYIDSVYYSGGIQKLVSTFIDGEWLSYYREDGNDLTLPERRYLIYLLLKYGYTAITDCESGDIMMRLEEEKKRLTMA